MNLQVQHKSKNSKGGFVLRIACFLVYKNNSDLDLVYRIQLLSTFLVKNSLYSIKPQHKFLILNNY